MPRFLIILVFSALVFATISYLLNKFFCKKYIKYILPTLALFASFTYFYISRRVPGSSGFQDLAYLLMSIILFSGALGGFIANIFFDLRKKG